MSKKHGLWRFHRLLREINAHRISRGMEPFDWAAAMDDEISWSRIQSAMNFYEKYHAEAFLKTKFSEIVRCANRFARRYGGVHTACQWNAICEKIAFRGAYFPASARAATLNRRGRLSLGPSEYDKPSMRFERSELLVRLERMRELRRRRRIQIIQVETTLSRMFFESSLIRQSIHSAKAAIKERETA